MHFPTLLILQSSNVSCVFYEQWNPISTVYVYTVSTHIFALITVQTKILFLCACKHTE